MPLQNPWVGYFDRTYEQIRDAVLTLFQSQVPEITDHTETASGFGKYRTRRRT